MKTYRNAARIRQWIRRAFTELMAEKKDISWRSVPTSPRPPFIITMRTFTPWRRNLKTN